MGAGLALAALAAPLIADAGDAPVVAPGWTRSLAAAPAPSSEMTPFVLLPLRDGTALVRNGEGGTSIRGAQGLNDGYVLVTDFFDGAWMGRSYYVVDAHTGAFLWSDTDFNVVDVTPETIAISPYPSMLPWGSAGYVVRRRLPDGAVLSTQTHDLPRSIDDTTRGYLARSTAATYVTAMGGSVFRFRRGTNRDPQRIFSGATDVYTLGNAAFIFVRSGIGSATVYLDRPSGRDTFATRLLGKQGGYISEPAAADWSTWIGRAGHVGGLIAVNDGVAVRLYDELGSAAMVVKSPCKSPYLTATRSVLFVVCAPKGSPVTVAGYARH